VAVRSSPASHGGQRSTRSAVTSTAADVARFDTNDSDEIESEEVVVAVRAYNADGRIGEAPVNVPDVVAVVRAYNSDESV